MKNIWNGLYIVILMFTIFGSGSLIAGCGESISYNDIDTRADIDDEQSLINEVKMATEENEENEVIEEADTEEISGQKVELQESDMSIEEVSNAYYELLSESTDETIVDILVENFENDGQYSAFAITSSNYSENEFEESDGFVYPAKLWFIRGEKCTLLKEDIQYIDSTLQNASFSNGIKPVMFHTWFSESSHLGEIYVVEAGEPKCLGSLEYAMWGENDTIMESKLVREERDGAYQIIGDEISVYQYENGELVLKDSWLEEY